jgi:hypothetical protein
MELDEDHDYPFLGTKHLDPIGINEEPVKLAVRTQNDFCKVDKLRNPEAPPAKSITDYEAYYNGEAKSRTQGLF